MIQGRKWVPRPRFDLTFDPGPRFSVAVVGTYRISQLADRVGIPATTLRYYEKVGLLPAQRTAAGYRVYDDAAADRLHFIAAGKHLGLPLDRIRVLLGVWESGACRDVRDELGPLIREQLIHAEQRRAELARFVERLTSALAHLLALPDRDEPCDPACSFLHARPGDLGGLPVEPVPVACSLPEDQYGTRMRDWHAVLEGAHRQSLPDGGVRVRLPVARAGRLADLMVAEQQCCPFLTFRLTLAGDHVALDAHAPDAAEALVAALFGERAGPC